MKTLPLICIAAGLSSLLPSLDAQVLSARRLTQRIAPLLPPRPTNAPRVVVVQPQVRNVPASVRPPQAGARPQRPLAEDPDRSARDENDSKPPETIGVPLSVRCKPVHPDSRESLQHIDLVLTNAGPSAVTQLTMRMIYLDRKGEKLKEWTTQRELDHPLPPDAAIELSQPAYYMPLITKTAKVEILAARFSDGTEWTPTTGQAALAGHQSR